MAVPLPRVLCDGWSPRRGVRYACHMPVMQPGEPGGREVFGTCKTCGALQKAAWRKASIRADQQARRDRRRGKTYGPADESTDVFAGFREKE